MKKTVLIIVALVLVAAAGFAAGVGWNASRLEKLAAETKSEAAVSGSQAQEDPDPEESSRLPDLNNMTEEEKKAYFDEIVDKEVKKFLDQIERKSDD